MHGNQIKDKKEVASWGHFATSLMDTWVNVDSLQFDQSKHSATLQTIYDHAMMNPSPEVSNEVYQW